MTKIADLKAKWMKNDDFKAEYDALDDEFAIIDALITARKKAALTQAEVALRMHTSQSYVAKMEAGKITPSLKALSKYARATNSRVRINLESVPG